jgi:membrane fusion protein, multidrug efflux system
VLGAQRQLSAARDRLETAQAQVREAQANVKKDQRRCRALQTAGGQERDSPANSTTPPWRPPRSAQATLDARKRRSAKRSRTSWWRRARGSGQQRITQADASIESARPRRSRWRSAKRAPNPRVAQVAQKKALLDQAKLNLSYCTIVAPVTGIVGKKTVELGRTFRPASS